MKYDNNPFLTTLREFFTVCARGFIRISTAKLSDWCRINRSPVNKNVTNKYINTEYKNKNERKLLLAVWYRES